jgi:hypothetical protein
MREEIWEANGTQRDLVHSFTGHEIFSLIAFYSANISLSVAQITPPPFFSSLIASVSIPAMQLNSVSTPNAA